MTLQRAGAAPGPTAGGEIDLHLHTTASDGSQPPAAVVAAAIGARLSAIAITDHDTVAGIAEARRAAEGTGLTIIAGVELSAYQGDNEVHVLGLHLERLATIDAALELFREARHERALKIVDRLNAIGVRITFEDVMAAAQGGALGRPHVARALVENGWAHDVRDAFDRYLGAGKPGFLEKRKLGMRDAIAMIHDAGGIAVLAHPGAGTGATRLEALRQVGLDGVEVLHPGHSGEDRRRLLEAADQLGLVPSGGSDSHGATEGSRVIGSMHVPYHWLEAQLRVTDRRRSASAA
ncbi:MAG: PHP domain-containing protein [Gemmatimonadota bacterium]